MFPSAYLLRCSFGPNAPTVALLGVRDGQLDLAGLPDRCRCLRQSGRVTDPMVLDARAVETMLLGRVETEQVQHLPINTLGNATVELNAGRFRMSGPWREHAITYDRWIEFEADYESRIILPDAAFLGGTPSNSGEMPSSSEETPSKSEGTPLSGSLLAEDAPRLGSLISRWRLARHSGREETMAELRWEIENQLLGISHDDFLLPEWLEFLLR